MSEETPAWAGKNKPGNDLLLEARKALRRGRIGEAERLVEEGKKKGASSALIQDLRVNIKLAVQKREKNRRMAGWAGFFLAIPLYIVLSFFITPPRSFPLWAGLTFFLIPTLIGLVAGRLSGAESRPSRRFWAGFRPCFWAVGWYASVNLMILHNRVGSTGDSTGVFFVGLAVTLAYAILAGIVAGIVAAKLTWFGSKPAPAVPAN